MRTVSRRLFPRTLIRIDRLYDVFDSRRFVALYDDLPDSQLFDDALDHFGRRHFRRDEQFPVFEPFANSWNMSKLHLDRIGYMTESKRGRLEMLR